MKLATREDISAPIEAVFEHLSDFAGFERAALRRGAEVVRIDSQPQPGPGMIWSAGFDFRGRTRRAEIELTDFAEPERMRVVALGSGLQMELLVELVAMSRGLTRMSLSVDARPRTMPARLMIQALKLNRAKVLKSFRRQVGDFAIDIEKRCRNEAL